MILAPALDTTDSFDTVRYAWSKRTFALLIWPSHTRDMIRRFSCLVEWGVTKRALLSLTRCPLANSLTGWLAGEPKVTQSIGRPPNAVTKIHLLTLLHSPTCFPTHIPYVLKLLYSTYLIIINQYACQWKGALPKKKQLHIWNYHISAFSCVFNSLRPSDAWSALRHYLIQCWNIVNWTLRKYFNEILHRIQTFLFKKISFENVVWKMAAILSRPQCVKISFLIYTVATTAKTQSRRYN